MTTPAGKFALVNVETGESFVFKYFPTKINTNRRTNWQPQDVTTGVQPLFYQNIEPRRLSIDRLLLDRSDTNQSVKSDLTRLLYFQDETDKGRPPSLFAVWGEYQELVVLEEVDYEQDFFTPEGDPIRAWVSLHLLEIQEAGVNTDSKIVDVDDEAANFDPLGNF